MEKHTLYYFTETYPFGLGEEWKTNELLFLKNEFERVVVIPFHYGNNFQSTCNFPSGIEYLKPLFENLNFQFSKFVFYKLINKNFFYFLNEFFKSKVYLKKIKLIKWFYNSLKVQEIYNHSVLQKLINDSSDNDIFYFFWGLNTCEVIPIVNIKGKKIVRMHGYDLYLDRNFGYIPYRQQLLNSVDKVLLISKNGLDYLKTNYLINENKLIINRIGVNSIELSIPSNDNVFRIYSCSRVIALKRLSLLVDALNLLTINVEWTHIGDGLLMNELKEEVTKLPPNIKVNLLGHIPPKLVTSFYSNNQIDLFVNVSTTEGIPVTIMEAISSGLPVMATNVGGTNEIVTEKLGVLLPSNINAKELSVKLINFHNLPKTQKDIFRLEALKMYNEKFNAEKNILELIKIIKD